MSGTIRRGKAVRADLALWDGRTSTYTRPDSTGGTTTGLVIGNDVDVLQVFGSGTDRTRTTVATAISSIATSVVTLQFAPGTWTIDDDLTIGSNFTCRVPAGCVFSVASGKTLTFSGDVLTEDDDSWYTGAGTVVVSRGGGHSAYFHRTAAERTASVTPSNYRFPPGNVCRYGATGDGSTDDSTAVQRAFNVARYGLGRVHFPAIYANGQTVFRCTGISVYEGTRVTTDDGVIVEKNGGAAFSHIFDCVGTAGSATALTSNASTGASSVAVSSASGLSVGQLVMIRDATYKFSTSGRNLELNEIESIASLTVTLKNRLIGSYAIASTAELVPVTTPARRIKFYGVNCRIPSGTAGGAFYFEQAYDCDVINCGCTGMEDQGGVQTWRAAYIRVTGGSYTDGQDQSSAGEGYGINFGEASHHCVAHGVFTRNVRENAVGLNARFCRMIDCVCVSPYDNGFNSHGNGATDCDFINCDVYSARTTAFVAGFAGASAYDERIRFINCTSYDSGGYGFTCTASAAAENVDIEFIDCRAIRPGQSVATIYGFYMSRATRPRLIDCTVDAPGSNVRAAVLFEICTGAVWRGGILRNVDSGWGILFDGCTGIDVDDTTITDIGSTTQGVRAEGTASTGVRVRRNRVDNDIVFTRNSGDKHEFNEYATLRDRVSGATSVADGGSISHGMVTTPTWVHVTPTTSGEFASVTAKTGTTFTVALKTHAGAAGTTQTVYWEAGL
jgi:hypothetical protein